MSHTPETEPSPRAGMQLWYCSVCTRMISPPGSEGLLGTDGARYCPKCHAARFATVAASDPAKKSSRSLIPAAKPAAASPARGSTAPATHAEKNSQEVVEKPAISPVVAFALGGAAIFLVAGLIYVFSGSKEELKAQKNEAPPASQPSQPLPQAPAVLSTAPRDAKPATDIQRKVPEVAAVKQPATKVEKKEQPQVPQPPPAQAPKAEVASAPKDTLKIEDFQKALARSKESIEARRFSAAFESLKQAREMFGTAEWFEAQKKTLSDTEQLAQEQLADFVEEVDDQRARLLKSESLAELEKAEAEWNEKAKQLGGRGISTASAPWIRLDPHQVQTSAGSVLTRQPDGAWQMGEHTPERDTFTLTSRVNGREITALRIEALPGADGRCGRGGNGNFAIGKVRLLARSHGSQEAPRELSVSHISFDYGQAGHQPEQLLDGDPNSHWAVLPHERSPHALVLHPTGLAALAEPHEISVVLEFQTQWGGHMMSKVRLSYSTLQPPMTATDPRALAAPEDGSSGDPLVLKPIEMLLRKVGERRAQLIEIAQNKQIAEIGQQLDAVEKLLKSRATRPEAIHKTLDSIESALPDLPATQALLERIAGLHFDSDTAKLGELSIFEANARQMGSGAELLYDFSTFEQYMAWSLDIPDGGGGAWYDAKAGHVKMQVLKKRNWDGDDRRNAPIVRLPFLFDPNNWVFEAAVTLLEDRKPNSKTQVGILVWDGGKNSVRLFFRENTAKDVVMQLAHNTPNQNLWSRVQSVKGGLRDTYVLNMTCINGQLAFSARTQAGAVVPLPVNKDKIGFEPRYLGFFLRSDDDNEVATASFDNARFTGQPLREKLKETYATNRLKFIANHKEKWNRKRALPPLEQAEREGQLGTRWTKLWEGRFIGNVGWTCNPGHHHGRDNVVQTHPTGIGVPFVWRRNSNLEAGKNWMLRFDVRGGKDWQLIVRINDQEVLNQLAGWEWKSIEVPLAKYAGSPVLIEIQHHCGGENKWDDEHAYWDNIRITPQ